MKIILLIIVMNYEVVWMYFIEGNIEVKGPVWFNEWILHCLATLHFKKSETCYYNSNFLQAKLTSGRASVVQYLKYWTRSKETWILIPVIQKVGSQTHPPTHPTALTAPCRLLPPLVASGQVKLCCLGQRAQSQQKPSAVRDASKMRPSQILGTLLISAFSCFQHEK